MLFAYDFVLDFQDLWDLQNVHFCFVLCFCLFYVCVVCLFVCVFAPTPLPHTHTHTHQPPSSHTPPSHFCFFIICVFVWLCVFSMCWFVVFACGLFCFVCCFCVFISFACICFDCLLCVFCFVCFGLFVSHNPPH